MLINDLIVFHKEKLSNWNLIFKHIKKEIIFISCSVIIAVLVIVLGVIFKLLYLSILAFIAYTGLLYYTNRRMKIVINNKHSIDVKKGLKWGKFKSYRVKQLKIFLVEKKIEEDKKVKEYKEFIDKEAERIRPSSYLKFGVPGLFLALGIPVWNHFNSWYFNNIISSVQEGIFYMTLILVGALMLSYIIGATIMLVREISETRYRRLCDLADLLELVYLSFDETVISTDIKKNL